MRGLKFAAAALLVTAFAGTSAVQPVLAQDEPKKTHETGPGVIGTSPVTMPFKPVTQGSVRTTLTVPAEVKGEVGAFIVVRGETDGKNIAYKATSKGLNVFPADLLADKKATVVTASAVGRYTLLSAACGADGFIVFGETVVVVGDAPPHTNGHTPPPKDPPTTPTKNLYFLVVRPDGPAAPDFAAYMGNPGWVELVRMGHAVKDKTVAEAAALGIRIPDGTVLPCVVTLKVAADGRSSTVVRGAIPAPAPGDIVKLPEGVK